MLFLGVKGAALKACEEKVDFLDIFVGVKEGDSTLKAFFDLLKEALVKLRSRPFLQDML